MLTNMRERVRGEEVCVCVWVHTGTAGIGGRSDVFLTGVWSKDCCRRTWFSVSMSVNFSSSLQICKQNQKQGGNHEDQHISRHIEQSKSTTNKHDHNLCIAVFSSTIFDSASRACFNLSSLIELYVKKGKATTLKNFPNTNVISSIKQFAKSKTKTLQNIKLHIHIKLQ